MQPMGTAVAAAIAVVALGATPLAPAGGSVAAKGQGHLYVVQAVPGTTYDVTIDGEEPDGSTSGDVLGPIGLDPGTHRVSLTGPDGALATTVRVPAGESRDLVVHLPADLGGDPVIDTYRVPDRPIAPGKARVLVAHTATVPPADVRMDGKTVFHNIANGEYVVADVPAGHHDAAIVPAGKDGPALLGPLSVDLPAGQVTLVYAVGSPRNGSMNVIAHQVRLPHAPGRAPDRVRTGSAGLVGRVTVHTFSSR